MERNYVSVTLCIPKFLHNPRNLPRLFPKLVFFGYSAEAAERTVSGRRNGSRWNAINSGAFDSIVFVLPAFPVHTHRSQMQHTGDRATSIRILQEL